MISDCIESNAKEVGKYLFTKFILAASFFACLLLCTDTKWSIDDFYKSTYSERTLEQEHFTFTVDTGRTRIGQLFLQRLVSLPVVAMSKCCQNEAWGEFGARSRHQRP